MGTCASVTSVPASTSAGPFRSPDGRAMIELEELQRKMARLLDENVDLREKMCELQALYARRMKQRSKSASEVSKMSRRDAVVAPSVPRNVEDFQRVRQRPSVDALSDSHVEVDENENESEAGRATIFDTAEANAKSELISRLSAELNATHQRVLELETELRERDVLRVEQLRPLTNSRSAKSEARTSVSGSGLSHLRTSAKRHESRQSSTLSHDSGHESDADQHFRAFSLSPHNSNLERPAEVTENSELPAAGENPELLNSTLRVGSLSSLTTLSEETPRGVGSSVRTCKSAAVRSSSCNDTEKATSKIDASKSPRVTQIRHDGDPDQHSDSLSFVYAQSGTKPILSARTASSSTTLDGSYGEGILSDREKQTALHSALNVVYH